MLFPVSLWGDSCTAFEVPRERCGVIEAQLLTNFLDGKVRTIVQQRFGLDDDIVGYALTGSSPYLFFDETAKILW